MASVPHEYLLKIDRVDSESPTREDLARMCKLIEAVMPEFSAAIMIVPFHKCPRPSDCQY